jgi:salicylate hydroxylase
MNMDEVTNDPECLQFGDKAGKCEIMMAPDKRVVMYPCRDHTLLNLVCIHKTEKSEEGTEGESSQYLFSSSF